MKTGTETEIKLAASPAMLERLRASALLAGRRKTATLVAVYYDTPDRALYAAGAALRIRTKGDGFEQTLKLPAGQDSPLHRGEWNARVMDGCLDFAALPEEPRAALAALLDGAEPVPFAETRIERETRGLVRGASRIEVAFDVGLIGAARAFSEKTREEAVCECELELREGRLADLLHLALDLPLGPDLRWSFASKAERAHALARGMPPDAVHARPAPVSRGMTVAEGLRAIGWACLAHLLANGEAIVASGGAEAVHQARVAIRRLRSAMSLFGPVLRDDPEAARLKAAFGEVASRLGDVRDLDVLMEPVAANAAGEDAWLLAWLRERREAAADRARDALASADFQRLALRFALWLETGAWAMADGAGAAGKPLEGFAARRLKRYQDCLSSGPVDAMSDRARHRLRIGVKKLRYATEFLAPLEGEAGPGAGFARNLARLQDRLGSLNDLSTANQRRDSLLSGLDAAAAARLSLWLDAGGGSRRRLLKDAERLLESVRGRSSA